jgi:GlpG protein
MSGVLYAMLGFIWVHKKINQNFEYSLPKFDIGMMIGWFFLCLTGALGPIANSAHGAGLVVGILTAVVIGFKWDKMHLKFFSLALFFLIFTLAVEGYKLGGRYYFLLSIR